MLNSYEKQGYLILRQIQVYGIRFAIRISLPDFNAPEEVMLNRRQGSAQVNFGV